MVRARSIFQAANLLAKSRDRDLKKWEQVFKGLHRKIIVSTLAYGDSTGIITKVCTSKEILLVFEAFSKIYKCNNLVNLNLTQKIPNLNDKLADIDPNPKYHHYAFTFYDLVILYLPLAVLHIDSLGIHETCKLLFFLKTLGQESYFIYNTRNKLQNKFSSNCESLSVNQIINLLSIFTCPKLQQNASVAQIIMPLINILNSNIMSLNIIEVFKIVNMLGFIRELPNTQIMYECYIRIREEYNSLSLKQITSIISSYSKHYKHTNVYINGFLSQISDFLTTKCSLSVANKPLFSNAANAKVMCQLFKSYSTVNYVDIPLFDTLFRISRPWRDEFMLNHYSTIANSLALIQSKHGVHLFNYTNPETNNKQFNQCIILPETYSNFPKTALFNFKREWIEVKEKLQVKNTPEPPLTNAIKFSEKNEKNALILIPKENYSNHLIRWWESLLNYLSSYLENLNAEKLSESINYANDSFKIVDSFAKSGQSHTKILTHLLNLIKAEIDVFSGNTILNFLCNLQSLQVDYSGLLETISSKKFHEFNLSQSLVFINLFLANGLALEQKHIDFLTKISCQPTFCNSDLKNLIEFTHPLTLINMVEHLYLNNLSDMNICRGLIEFANKHLSIRVYQWLVELTNSNINKCQLQVAEVNDIQVNDNLLYSRIITDFSSTYSFNKPKLLSIVIKDNSDYSQPKIALTPYHWELDSFKKSIHLLQEEFSRYNIPYKSKCTINSCPIDLIYSHSSDNGYKFVILCLSPEEFLTPLSNYTSSCYWKTRLDYISAHGYQVKVISCRDIICKKFSAEIIGLKCNDSL